MLCKQECPHYNEATLWKDRMRENSINVNMAIRLPPSRRNMANLSHSYRTTVNHFVTLQTFIWIVLARRRGEGKLRAKPEICVQLSQSSNYALKAPGEHTNCAVRYPQGKYPFTSQQHRKVCLKSGWKRKADIQAVSTILLVSSSQERVYLPALGQKGAVKTFNLILMENITSYKNKKK